MSRPRVLIVGDGNFSFSLAYCEKFKNEDVVATSFDSRHSLIEKYPEAHFILVRLERMATVRHEIDGCSSCTTNPACQLPQTLFIDRDTIADAKTKLFLAVATRIQIGLWFLKCIYFS